MLEQEQSRLYISYVGNEFRYVFNQVEQQFLVVGVDCQVDEFKELWHRAFVTLQGYSVARARTIDYSIPAHEIAFVQSSCVCAFAPSGTEESAIAASPVGRLPGKDLQ